MVKSLSIIMGVTFVVWAIFPILYMIMPDPIGTIYSSPLMYNVGTMFTFTPNAVMPIILYKFRYVFELITSTTYVF